MLNLLIDDDLLHFFLRIGFLRIGHDCLLHCGCAYRGFERPGCWSEPFHLFASSWMPRPFHGSRVWWPDDLRVCWPDDLQV
jgi:hypothetical protein